jgi:tRNA threonylcarbamoyl adenosine modification protein YeaZ
MIGLSFESCFQSCSVSLLREGIIKSKFEERRAKHSEKLAEMTKEILEENNISTQDIEFLCTNLGPGSFTGIRIGLSFAEGFGFAFPNIKQYYISSFQSTLGAMEKFSSGKVCIILKAVRDTFYTQIFDNFIPISKPEYKNLEEMERFLRENSYDLFGDFEGFFEKYSIISNKIKPKAESSMNFFVKHSNLLTFDKTPLYLRNNDGF